MRFGETRIKQKPASEKFIELSVDAWRIDAKAQFSMYDSRDNQYVMWNRPMWSRPIEQLMAKETVDLDRNHIVIKESNIKGADCVVIHCQCQSTTYYSNMASHIILTMGSLQNSFLMP